MKYERMTEAEFNQRFGYGRFAWKLWLPMVVSGLLGIGTVQILIHFIPMGH